ncbi:MAG: hypothetical protein LBD31_08055 [Treponema sp.]|jgi:hypothetical protein|nr:hypothetical protein [Treponema sp.]
MKRAVFFLAAVLFTAGSALSQEAPPVETAVPSEPRFPSETYDVFIPSRTGPSVVPGSEELPRSFRQLSLGMGLDELKTALAADGLFAFRGDPDVSFLPVKEENLVETAGLSFIRRAFFQLREGKVFIMAFAMDPGRIDHYSVFTSLVKRYGEPLSLNPREVVWENEKTRISLERPLTVKYIDMEVFKAIMGEAKAEESLELIRRRGFLDEL